ncbi:GNAT family N-acetyltransferase [Streptomyces cyaneofuscatus]|uniref:GNAT family N-acetyltransferase n=1 Tax=Streptomyces cyaneofuscatus TaxID=66883 RepID=UPI0033B7118B
MAGAGSRTGRRLRNSRGLRLLGFVPGAAVLGGRDDHRESGLEEITSPVFVVRDGGARVLAAAGYAHWPRGTAHVCVLTAPDARGRGLARQVASEATAHALAAGLLPQWRARPARLPPGGGGAGLPGAERTAGLSAGGDGTSIHWDGPGGDGLTAPRSAGCRRS